MGLWDDIKTGAKNVDSKVGQKYDEEKIELEIRRVEREVEDMKRDLGNSVYDACSKGETYDPGSDCKKIKSKIESIDALKKEKEEIIVKAKAERGANRQARN